MLSAAPARAEGVVLLHGIARSSAAMRPMERALAEAGYRTLNFDYPARRYDIETLSLFVADRTASFATGCDRVHCVTHSLGGLVADAMIRLRRPANLGRVVMLGPPNQGSEIADLLVARRATAWAFRHAFGPAGAALTTHAATADGIEPVDYPLAIIAGTRAVDPLSWALLPKPNDGKVSVARTRREGMSGHLVLPTTHALMMRNPAVIRATLAFLRDGAFERARVERTRCL